MTFRAKGPQDLAAAVPIVLGFQPENSVVMMCFRGATPFHARLDLPPAESYFPQAVEALLAPALRHEVSAVAFLFYTPVVRGLPAKLSRLLYRAFMDSGIEVIETVRVHGSTIWPQPPCSSAPHDGITFDASAHHYRTKAVTEGHVVLGSRDSLKAQIAPQEVLVNEFQKVLETTEPLTPNQLNTALGNGLSEGELPLTEAAALLRTMDGEHFFVAFQAMVDVADARDALRFLLWLIQRTPEADAPTVLPFLALTAWLRGDGALAWVAVDRLMELKPGSRLGRMVAALLENAVPPQAWNELRSGQ